MAGRSDACVSPGTLRLLAAQRAGARLLCLHIAPSPVHSLVCAALRSATLPAPRPMPTAPSCLPACTGARSLHFALSPFCLATHRLAACETWFYWLPCDAAPWFFTSIRGTLTRTLPGRTRGTRLRCGPSCACAADGHSALYLATARNPDGKRTGGLRGGCRLPHRTSSRYRALLLELCWRRCGTRRATRRRAGERGRFLLPAPRVAQAPTYSPLFRSCLSAAHPFCLSIASLLLLSRVPVCLRSCRRARRVACGAARRDCSPVSRLPSGARWTTVYYGRNVLAASRHLCVTSTVQRNIYVFNHAAVWRANAHQGLFTATPCAIEGVDDGICALGSSTVRGCWRLHCVRRPRLPAAQAGRRLLPSGRAARLSAGMP